MVEGNTTGVLEQVALFSEPRGKSAGEDPTLLKGVNMLTATVVPFC
jgi:hypothetical protein